MINSVKVSGKFHDGSGQPIKGRIAMIPSRFWVEHEDQAWACLAPDVALDEDGGFSFSVTPTHGHDNFPWYYTIYCPIGTWKVRIQEGEHVSIRKLLPARDKR